MAEKNVSIRIRIADYELEVKGPKKWAEETTRKFVARIKKQQVQKSRCNTVDKTQRNGLTVNSLDK